MSKELIERARNAHTSLGHSLHFGICAELADRIEELERALFAAQQALLTEGIQRDALLADNERLRKALEKLSDWAKAYPLSVFPEPDFKRANEVLKANGMTLDAISASNMRHVIVQVQGIVDAALAMKEPK